jgi:RND superfamily putative drug exporter
MTGPLYAIGRFCSRHHWPVIGAWVVLAVALLAISGAAGSKTSENLTLPGTGSTISTELLEENLPQQAYGSNPLVFEAPAGKSLSEPKYAAAIEETVGRLRKLPNVNSAESPLHQGSKAISKDQRIAYIPVVLADGPGEINEEQAEEILDTAASTPRSAATSASSSRNRRPSSPRSSA